VTEPTRFEAYLAGKLAAALERLPEAPAIA
jgi:hypothetical protein